MKISENGLKLIEKFEGFRSHPYLDAVGVWTIGFGTTHMMNGLPVSNMTKPISENEATELMKRQITHSYGAYLNRYIGSHNTTQNQFDALVSFEYNLGANALHHSTLLKKHLNGDFKGASKEFLKWVNAAGKRLKGLVRRRKAEKQMYLS